MLTLRLFLFLSSSRTCFLESYHKIKQKSDALIFALCGFLAPLAGRRSNLCGRGVGGCMKNKDRLAEEPKFLWRAAMTWSRCRVPSPSWRLHRRSVLHLLHRSRRYQRIADVECRCTQERALFSLRRRGFPEPSDEVLLLAVCQSRVVSLCQCLSTMLSIISLIIYNVNT